MAAIKEKSWTYLRHDGGLDVCVITKDEDWFILPLEEAIAACKSYDEAKRFLPQFGELLDRLNSWLVAHAEKVDRAYVSLGQEGGVVDFVVILNSKVFDQLTEESLVELDLEIAHNNAFDRVRLRIISLPYCSESTALSFARPTLSWVPQRQRS